LVCSDRFLIGCYYISFANTDATITALIVWSGGIELVQPYVNRHSDWMDLLTNCAGIVIGAVIALIINYTFLRSAKLK